MGNKDNIKAEKDWMKWSKSNIIGRGGIMYIQWNGFKEETKEAMYEEAGLLKGGLTKTKEEREMYKIRKMKGEKPG